MRSFAHVIAILALVHCSDTPPDDPIAQQVNVFVRTYCQMAKPCCDRIASQGSACEAFIRSLTPPSYYQPRADACLAAVRATVTEANYCTMGVFLANHKDCSYLGTPGTTLVGGKCSNYNSSAECALNPQGQVGCVYGRRSERTICQLQLLGGEGDTPCAATTGDDGTIPTGTLLDVDPQPKSYYCDRRKRVFCNKTTLVCERGAPVGSTCEQENYECAPDAYCDVVASVCKPRVALGAPCADTRSCPDHTRCSFEEPIVCAARLADGKACRGGGDCISGVCSEGLCGTDRMRLGALCGR